MKKVLAGLLGMIMLMTVVSFTACSDEKVKDLVEGDYSEEATDEQIVALRADINSGMVGDKSASDWYYSVDYSEKIDVDMKTSVQVQGESASFTTKLKSNMDYLFTFTNGEYKEDAVGSGEMYYNVSNLGSQMLIDTSCYNDNDYFYLDGKINVNDQSVSGKYKLSMNYIFSQGAGVGQTIDPDDLFGSIVEVETLLELLDDGSTKVFVDTSDETVDKYKFSVTDTTNLQAGFEDSLGSTDVVVDLSYLNIFLVVDKETGFMVNLGTQMKLSLNFSLYESGLAMDNKLSMTSEVFMQYTSEKAELPDDLSSYNNFYLT